VHLHAAFIPPLAVRQALVELIAEQEPSGQDPVSGRRGLFGRRTSEQEVAPAPPQLRALDPESLALPITDFGYVSSGDARRMTDTLTQVLGSLPSGPTVHISGGEALVDDDDRSVWATLAGAEEDLAAMRTIAGNVVSAVEPLGFFCDRRQFRGRLPIATITDSTSLEHLERVLSALASYSSESWTVDEVAILQRGSGLLRAVPVGGLSG
jgi:hypothetical protein